MKFEFSAGGIVLRQAQDFGSKPQFSKKRIEVLVCQHSQHHGWVFPKGLIDKKQSAISNQQSVKETKEEAALREVKEETGISGKIIKPLTPVTYWYAFKGDPSTGSGQEKIKKTVYYFLMEYVSGDTKDHDFEMENVEWLAMDEAEGRLTYKSDKEVWEQAKEKIRNLNIEIRNGSASSPS